MKRSGRCLLTLAVAATLTFPGSVRAQKGEVGKVQFANSGAPEAQADFQRGLALLHDFEYEAAAEAFRRAQAQDPGFAMAYWGEAMTYNHPVWMQQDRAAARDALGRLAATPEGRLAKARTQREKDYLRALHVLYGEGDKEARDDAYMEEMRRLHERYPDDPDAAAFYALALLGTAHEGRDIPTYMRAAAVVEEVFRDHPEHPGAAHYLIHSYDDPIHAPLGLRAARTYSRIAPAAGHAQHMTSHIFVAMGMWPDVVRANEAAVAVQDGDRAARGLPPNRCGHYTTWLEYGYLQQGRYGDARGILEPCHERAASGASPAEAAYFADQRARYVLDTGDWTGPVARMEPEATQFGARHLHAFVSAYAAFQRGETAMTERSLVAMTRARESEVEARRERGDGNPERLPVQEIAEMELRALISLRQGNGEKAVELMDRAASMEEAMPYEFGPPAVAKPTHELRGEILLELGRPGDAAEAFRTALTRTPRRTQALLGLARAAELAGDVAASEDAYRELREIWSGADADVPEIRAVMARGSGGAGRR